MSLFDYASTNHGTQLGLAGVQRRVGSSCDNFNGFCDNSGACISSTQDIGFGDAFNNIDASAFLEENWPVLVGVLGGLILLAVLLKVTYREKKVEIDKAFTTMKRRVQSVKHRTLGRHNRPTRMASIRGGAGSSATTRHKRMKKSEFR